MFKKKKQLFDDNLFQKLSSYDPSVEQKRTGAQRYAKVKSLKRLLKGFVYLLLNTQNQGRGHSYNVHVCVCQNLFWRQSGACAFF